MRAAQIPTHGQILLPLLEVLQEHGPLGAREAAGAVADKLGLSAEERSLSIRYSRGRAANVFRRKVRWARQSAVAAGLMLDRERNRWELADEGKHHMAFARPGVAICVARSDAGAVLWAQARSAFGYVEKGSVSLILTSPPFPLVEQREYGTAEWSPDRYIDTFIEHAEGLRPLLTCDGSLVLNLGDVYVKGAPVLNSYQERIAIALEDLGWNLCGRGHWFSPSKPKTTSYVTRTRERVANGMETLWWWSPTAHPKADNRAVLQPYSARHERMLSNGGWFCPGSKLGSQQSGRGMRYRVDHGGAIPFNLITCGSEGNRGPYFRYCKEHGLPWHGARMPRQIADFWIRFTTAPGDVVADPFAGSLTTAAAAQALGRRFIVSEQVLQYLEGGVGGRLAPLGPVESCFHFLGEGRSPGGLAAAQV